MMGVHLRPMACTHLAMLSRESVILYELVYIFSGATLDEFMVMVLVS